MQLVNQDYIQQFLNRLYSLDEEYQFGQGVNWANQYAREGLEAFFAQIFEQGEFCGACGYGEIKKELDEGPDEPINGHERRMISYLTCQCPCYGRCPVVINGVRSSDLISTTQNQLLEDRK